LVGAILLTFVGAILLTFVGATLSRGWCDLADVGRCDPCRAVGAILLSFVGAIAPASSRGRTDQRSSSH
jgi:hypothetical protein